MLRAKGDELGPRLVPHLVVAKRVLTSLAPLLLQATSECSGGLDVQGLSFPQQIRPLPESAKIKLLALLPQYTISNELLRPLDFGRLNPRLARSSRLVEKLCLSYDTQHFAITQQMRDGEVLR